MAEDPKVIWQGNPISSSHQPDPSQIVNWAEDKDSRLSVLEGLNLETRVSSLETTVTSGQISKAPVALLVDFNTDLTGEKTVDGTLTSGSRVAVTAQTNAIENGIYITASGGWSRATDMNASDEVHLTSVFVEGGTAHGGQTWKFQVDDPANFALGVNAIDVVKVGDSGALQDQIDDKASLSALEIAQRAARWHWSVPINTATSFSASYAGSGIVTVGWTAVRLINGQFNSASKIPDRAAANLANGQCLYVDVSEVYPGDPGYTVVEATWSSIEADLVTGSKLLLVANQDGNIYGALADQLKNAQQDALNATARALNTEQARLSRHQIGSPGVYSSSGLDVFPIVGSASVSVSWSALVILQGQSNLGRLIADLPVTTLAHGQGLYYDSAESYSGSYTVVQAAMSGIGNMSVTGGLILLLGNINGRLVGLLAEQAEASIQRLASDREELILTGGTDTLYIHRKGGKKGSSRYIRWTYQLSDNAAINSAVWRVAKVEEVERTGRWSFTTVATLVGAAEEIEFAVKESGATTSDPNAGFIGGLAHGNHTMVDVEFRADGVVVTPSAALQVICRRLEVFQKSQLWYYDWAGGHEFDQNEKLGLLWSRWDFSGRTAKLDQTVKWERAITTSPCFMAMMPFARGTAPDYYASRARRAPYFEAEDITATSGTTSEKPAEGGVVQLLGTEGVSGERRISLLSGDVNNPAEWIAMQATKNKAYVAVHRGTATVIGDEIRIVAEFDIDAGN